MLKNVPCEPYLVGRVVYKAPQKNSITILLKEFFYAMGPHHFLPDHLFCLSHRKTRWTISTDYVGLKLCLLGTSTFMVTLTFFPKLSWDEFNNQINTLTWPWDDFMVHGVNNAWLNSLFWKLPVLDIYYKKINQHIHFLVHGHSSWSTSGLHLMRGPKALWIDFLGNRIMEVGPSSGTMENGHIPWSTFMVHGVDRPLLLVY